MDGYIEISPECSVNENGTIISYKDYFYYRSCGVPVKSTHEENSFCVKRDGHPGILHEDWDGNVRGNSGLVSVVEKPIKNTIADIASPDVPNDDKRTRW